MSGTWHGGKGSSTRPKSVSQQEYEARWDAIFGRDVDVPKTEDKVETDPKTSEMDNPLQN